MEINKETIEAILILLYKLEEFEVCEAMLEVYKKHFDTTKKYDSLVKHA